MEVESEEQQIAIHIAFNFSQMEFGWKACSRKGAHEAGRARNKNDSRELTVISSQLNGKLVRPRQQSCTGLKFEKSKHNNEEFYDYFQKRHRESTLWRWVALLYFYFCIF